MVKINIYAITDTTLLDEDVQYAICDSRGTLIDKFDKFIKGELNRNPEDDYEWLESSFEHIFTGITSFDFIKNPVDRAVFLSHFYEKIEEYDSTHANEVELKFYIMTPDAQIYSIKDFDKITDKIDAMNDQIKKDIMENYIDYQNQRDEMEKENKDDKNEMRKIQIIVLSQSLTKLMLKNIEDNKEEIEDNMCRDILTVREEEANIIRTEFDIVEKFMKDNGLEEVKECTYNGEAIELEDLAAKIQMHTLPAFLTQINIMDTLQDEYTIKTEKGTIHRKHGGRIELE